MHSDSTGNTGRHKKKLATSGGRSVMEGLKHPIFQNFEVDRESPGWSLYSNSMWKKCTICGEGMITDRVQHNMTKHNQPPAFYDPLGILVETIFALWG
jgi:hypothetical protein